MSLISIYDTEFVNDKKISKSPYVIEAIKRLQRKRKIKIEDNEDVIDIGEMFLEMFNIIDENNKFKGNKNAVK